MISLKRGTLGILGALLLAMTTGCVGDPRTSNQGGGTLLTAASKLMGGSLKSMTADEWQILADNLPTLAADFGINLGNLQIPSLTDEQAAAIVDFLNVHDLNTIEQVTQAIQSGAIDEDDIPPELLELL
ncbi:MAG TPA: hypothetical protein PKG54_17495 [Phycisphaerae bacterium]|jgi:hypothetical protein|nr:hypothetical protein [Phycisphaerae bacterium]HOB76308.1 hypothetical protein [Phycisphaerae bacterium]HOJ53796.1 hypothetical protein [Phycisphaerae bacterium]HOL28270.1 hypothetical protein [Phycisphaerae bacterium]HPP21478.1 hypothetical protein [Phycisphaerae bacterium]